ncbi:hypothetical protein M9H77_15986 [Catharanthus roseus]|uniref:Uncharacterized protein n=1 Tax=Catharanthus roseus TaxID=4058 RepID=A0ACC0AYP2_CATRO|nr:hypothetical protein M9H77_15986 [Catharanthus roseus]
MYCGNGDIQKVIQDIEALRDRMDVQEAAYLDQHFDEMINRFDALRVNSNRNRNDGGQRPKDQLTRGGVANVHVAANIQNQVASYNFSDENEDLILAEDQNRPTRRGVVGTFVFYLFGSLGMPRTKRFKNLLNSSQSNSTMQPPTQQPQQLEPPTQQPSQPNQVEQVVAPRKRAGH